MSRRKDPKRFYRIEARELLDSLSKELLALSRGEGRADAVQRLFRDAHTLKGAAIVVGDDPVVDIARILEDVLGEHRDNKTLLEAQEIDEFLRMVEGLDQLLSADTGGGDDVADEVAAPTPVAQGNVAAAQGAGRPAQTSREASMEMSDNVETVRVELNELDGVTANLAGAELQNRALLLALKDIERITRNLRGLIDDVGGSAAASSEAAQSARRERVEENLRELIEQLSYDHRTALSRADALAHELRQVRDRVGRLELVPVSTVFPVLERGVRLAASSVNKSARFVGTGGEARVDRRVLPQVKDALLHMIRNAVDHGLEEPKEREAAGKPAEGTVTIHVEPRGSRIAFVCRDDGRGIDPDAVRRAATERGMVENADALDDRAVLRLLFRSGLSTKSKITDLSGRGVGLDVVGTAALALKGEATIASELGSGTSVELVVPLSLSTALAVVLRTQDGTVLLPMDAVNSILRMPAESVQNTQEGEVLACDGALLPVLRVETALGQNAQLPAAGTQQAFVVLSVENERFVLAADAAQGIVEAVVRPLPWAAGIPTAVAGAALDVDGGARLVLDARGLFAISKGHIGASSGILKAAQPQRFMPILVIDDSLTTRMLEQSILETAGFEVDVATCAEEGLEMAQAREYGLFVCDVEMPGLNGFQFTAKTRADARLKETPVILVTSLASDEDKQRGRDAGASAYVVKGQFDQDYFMDRVRSLLRVEQ